LSLEGLTTETCYPNQPFSHPSDFCRRECHDGSPFSFNYYPVLKRYTNFTDIVNLFKTNEKLAVLAVVKVDDAFNYYSAFKPVLSQGGPRTVYEYRVA
jgi:hypothetical protein